MKIIVKYNKVIGVYKDDQNIDSLYNDCNIRILPNNFKYDSPIEDKRVIPEFPGYTIYDRYTIINNDIDPLLNYNNISLNNRKLYAGESISYLVNQYIQYKANGEVRYTQAKQSSFTDIHMYCKEWLEDNPESSIEEKEPYETRITLINTARAWIREVLSYYYDYVTLIRNATEINWYTAISWDFSTFDATDPDIWLETVKI